MIGRIMTERPADVGVIVGRFQVPDLHEAHKQLIESVCEKHDKVIIFLGKSPLPVTAENPLDFESRKQMILAEFPQVNVLYINDMYDDTLWSVELDFKIKDLTTPAQSVMLYGGRDSFIGHYVGDFQTSELKPEVYVNFSGTAYRKQIAGSSTQRDPAFRAGAIWAARGKYPTCYPTVDIVILDGKGKMLLAKKPFEDKWRFIGGFADCNSKSYEADARREVHEEAGIEITDPKYVGSTVIEDWRYRNEPDQIKTLLFCANYSFGTLKPDDDIAELAWFHIISVNPFTLLMPNHVILFQMWRANESNPSN